MNETEIMTSMRVSEEQMQKKINVKLLSYTANFVSADVEIVSSNKINPHF